MMPAWQFFLLGFFCVFFLAATTAVAAPSLSNSIGIEFQRIPSGVFLMGSNEHTEGAFVDGFPVHTVTIPRPFYLGTYEVTQAQWMTLMGSNPSDCKGDNNPVTNVSWEDAQKFIRRLNEKENTTAYRLPTEAEWEYAARAGAHTAYAFGEDASLIMFHAWYNFNSGGTCHPVGMKKTNAFGLHDMQGNVSEWVWDFYNEEYTPKDSVTDPPASASGQNRVVRGCSWNHRATFCRSAVRFNFEPGERNAFIGFRVLKEID